MRAWPTSSRTRWTRAGGPRRRATTADLLFLAYWNLVYHTGQINYLQTMLGDTVQRL